MHIEQRTYFYTFTLGDIRALVAGALIGKADQWDEDASAEGLKGAANQGKIGTLKWGSNQLRDLAAIILSIPDGETRVTDVEIADPIEYDSVGVLTKYDAQAGEFVDVEVEVEPIEEDTIHGL